MKMRVIHLWLLLLASIPGMLSCERELIVDASGDYYLAIEAQLPRDFPAESIPDMYRVLLYNDEGIAVYNSVIYPANHPSGMPEGAYLPGVEAGTYYLLVYSFDKNNSIVENERQIESAYIHTNVIGDDSKTQIVEAPTHIFIDSRQIKLPEVIEKTYTLTSKPVSPVEEWDIYVHGVQNISGISTVSAYLSGQCRSMILNGRPKKINENVILSFTGNVEDYVDAKGKSEKVIHTGFKTYGRMTDDTKALYTLLLKGPGERSYYGQTEITQEIIDQQDRDHVTHITMNIELKDDTPDGFNPIANEWEEDITLIELT